MKGRGVPWDRLPTGQRFALAILTSFYVAVRFFWLAVLFYLVCFRLVVGDRYWLGYVAGYVFVICPLATALFLRKIDSKRGTSSPV
jgi:hypothetical protein